jgi:hypothetical protein
MNSGRKRYRIPSKVDRCLGLAVGAVCLGVHDDGTSDQPDDGYGCHPGTPQHSSAIAPANGFGKVRRRCDV